MKKLTERAARPSRHLFYEEINRNKRIGWLLGLGAVLLVSAIIVISNFTYSSSASKYYKQQAYDTMTEVSTQMASTISDNIASWYEQLNLAMQFLSMDTLDLEDQNQVDEVFEQLNRLQFSIFDRIGFISDDGYLIFSTGEWYEAFSEAYIQQFGMEHTGTRYAGPLDIPALEDKLAFVIPYPSGRQENGQRSVAAILGIINKSDISQVLETDIFGENLAYVVISDADGNVIVDTKSKKQFGENLLDTFATFASGEVVEQLRSDLKAGNRNTMDLMGVTREFLTYYAPLMGEEHPVGDSEYSVYNWRIMILTRTDILAKNVSSLFNESRVMLYATLAVLMVCLIVMVCLLVRKRNNELKLQYIDPLTNVLNDSRFEIDGNLLLARSSQPYALISYNIVQFKLINTRIGHEKADQILKKIGQTIQDFLSKEEIVAHSFADRFIVLMKMEKDFDEKRIRELEQLLMDTEYPDNTKLKFTIGVYSLKEEDKEISIAIDRARFAQSKTREGFHVLSNLVVYSQEMFENQKEEGTLADMAEGALTNHHFYVYYQLKRNIQKDEWLGSEALVRWKDPKLGFLYPGKFIPLFERNGFVVKLDKYVFETVCRDLRQSIDNGEKIVPVSVNLSKCHLENENFLDDYEKIMHTYRIPPEYIEFEITEGLVDKNAEMMKQVIDRIHAMGCKCSLDDFGIGYSSFNMIKEYAFDTIKLDQSFFHGFHGFDQDSQLIVEMLIELSHKLGKEVVSEGVESREQVDFLLQKQCDAIQGYYYSRPSPVEEYKEMLTK